MKVKIQVVIENDQGQVEDVQQVACLRRGPLTPEELGLNLAEAKQILHGVQESMVASQVNDYMDGQRPCPHCGARRTQKGRHEIRFRTLFGEAVSVRAFAPASVCAQRKAEIASELGNYFAEVDAARAPASEADAEAILNEAMQSVRPGYRPRQ